MTFAAKAKGRARRKNNPPIKNANDEKTELRISFTIVRISRRHPGL
jgi:hypothetical protein